MGKPIWVACGTHLGYYGQHIKVIWSLMRENLSLGGGGGANNKGADQPALLLCLISPLVVRFLCVS